MVGVVGLILLIFVFMFIGIIPGFKSGTVDPRLATQAKLTMWGVKDSKQDLESIFSSFATLYPKVEIQYRQFQTFDQYQKALLNALASGAGPDIFAIRNTDLPSMINKITPAPQTYLPAKSVNQLFPQVVSQDFTQQGNVYALPLSIDTLALFYNRDLLDQEAVGVPSTWDDFVNIIPKLTKIDKTQNITFSGAAIGGSTKSIPEASDILSLLMLQTGTQMVSPDFTTALFNSKEGVNALTFYTQFADNRSDSYSWNDGFSNDLDAFAQEKTAMIFTYADSISEIQKRNAFLNFQIAEAPQPKDNQKAISYASYYGYTISKQSKYANVAWDLLSHTLTVSRIAKQYTDTTHNPPALSELNRLYKDDASLGVFARQALIARSWAQADADVVRSAFSKAIEVVNANILTPERALGQAQDQVTASMVR